MSDFSLSRALLWLIPLVIAIAGHELGHAWMARRLGDDTAEREGRITWNPMAHVDPFGTVILPATLWLLTPVMFGWAKPVPVNPGNFANPRRDMIWVALAGPGANLVMSVMWAFGWRLAMEFQAGVFPATLCLVGVTLNVAIALFNLMPILPLDGGRVLACLLPPRFSALLERLTLPAVGILLALLFFGQLGAIIGPLIENIWDAILQFASII